MLLLCEKNKGNTTVSFARRTCAPGSDALAFYPVIKPYNPVTSAAWCLLSSLCWLKTKGYISDSNTSRFPMHLKWCYFIYQHRGNHQKYPTPNLVDHHPHAVGLWHDESLAGPSLTLPTPLATPLPSPHHTTPHKPHNLDCNAPEGAARDLVLLLSLIISPFNRCVLQQPNEKTYLHHD